MNETSTTIEVRAVGQLVGRQRAGVGALDHRHALVLAQAVVELAVGDVERDDVLGAALEQAVGEAAGGGADVQRAAAGDVEPERVERVGELDAAARDVGRRAVDVELDRRRRPAAPASRRGGGRGRGGPGPRSRPRRRGCATRTARAPPAGSPGARGARPRTVPAALKARAPTADATDDASRPRLSSSCARVSGERLGADSAPAARLRRARRVDRARRPADVRRAHRRAGRQRDRARVRARRGRRQRPADRRAEGTWLDETATQAPSRPRRSGASPRTRSCASGPATTTGRPT